MRPSYWRHKIRSWSDSALRFLYGPKGFLARKRNRFRVYVILGVILAALTQSKHAEPGLLQKILDRGELSVGFRLGPLIYFERDREIGGLDYYILHAFAEQLGVDLKLRLYDEIPEILAAVEAGELDIGAANLTVTPERQNRVSFSDAYLQVSPLLIQHSSRPSLDSIADIGDSSLVVIAGSSHAELLRTLKQEYPDIRWQEENDTLMFQLMERVQDREIDFAIVDSSIYELERAFFPRIEVAQNLGEESPLAFALQKTGDLSLISALNRYLDEVKQSGELKELIDEVYSNSENYNIASSLTLRERIETRLPEFEALFRRIGEEVGIDWVLLAAVAYQESHWNPAARSYTGVRGLMMLTLPTAAQYGVSNRLDAEQSLRGGARYLKSLINRLPARISETNRVQMALAAYNMGMGHLQDARILTQRAGKDPDSWEDVRAHLHLLQQSLHYKTVTYGYARGLEARNYVDSINQFYNILESYALQKELEAWDFSDDISDEVSPGLYPDFPSALENPLSPL